MANNLKPMVKSQVIQLFRSTQSISRTTREAGVSRNTVRKIIRESCDDESPTPNTTEQPKKSHKLDFSLIEKLFENSKQPGDNLEFQKHITHLVDQFAEELQTTESAVDTIRLESAIMEYLAYRQSYFRSYTAGNASYLGPYSKAHDKLARAARDWITTAQKSFENFNLVISELELKRDRRLNSR